MALTDDLFESIDTIVKARIASLPYDQTIEGTIIDISNASNGIYIVRSQVSSLRALAEPNKYVLGDDVYVQVPQNDYKKDCIILSKKENTETSSDTTILPFLNIVYDTNNYFKSDYVSKEVEIRTTADGKETTVKIPTIALSVPIVGYTKLGLKFAVSSDIQKKMSSGNYGMIITLKGYNQKTTHLNQSKAILSQTIFGQNKEYILTSEKDMIGINLYNTLGYCNQQKVFDITNLVITEIEAYLWQDGNFKDINKSLVENKSIKFTNFQLYLGYDKNDFANETEKVYIYTYDGLTYNSSYNDKKLQFRIVNLNDDNKTITITEISKKNDYPNIKYSQYWEQYDNNYKNNQDYEPKQYFKKMSDDFIFTTDFVEDTITKEQRIILVLFQSKYSMKISNELVFKNGIYLEDEDLAVYLKVNNERINNNFEKIINALKKIDASIDIQLE